MLVSGMVNLTSPCFFQSTQLLQGPHHPLAHLAFQFGTSTQPRKTGHFSAAFKALLSVSFCYGFCVIKLPDPSINDGVIWGEIRFEPPISRNTFVSIIFH